MCQHLRLRHFFGGICSSLGTIRIRVGLIGEIQTRCDTCDFCKLLREAVSTQWKAQYDENVFDHDIATEAQITVYLCKRTPESIVAMDAKKRSCRVWLDCVWMGKNGDGQSRVRSRTNETFSLDLIREWVTDCHGFDHVHDHQARLLPPGFMVIDIKNDCIKVLEAVTTLHYVALNYVWGPPGDKPELLATTETIENLQKPGFLCKENLPATIWDSMAVCTAIEVPYLWVDRLCIIQDGCEANKLTQIGAMDQIYSHAVLTICASGSVDSRSGLCGTHERPRICHQGHARIGTLDLLAQLPNEMDWRSQVWWKRAWTYQELLLSPRKLIFSPWEVTFRCDEHNKIEFEGPTAGRSPHAPIANDGRRDSPAEAYFGVVSNYNNRALRFDTDIFNAFMGIFKRIFGNVDQLLYGLPKLDFDEALLWNVCSNGPEGQGQRVPRVIVGSADIAIPSWSWASARGYTTWMRNPRFDNMRVCSSLVKWVLVDRQNVVHKAQCIIAHGSREKNGYGDWGVMYTWSAWAMGCIEKKLPSQLDSLSNWDYGSSYCKAEKRWSTYRRYWKDAFGSRSPWIRDSTKEFRLAKEKLGRVILRAALAKATIRCDHQGCKLQDTNNATVGILVANHDCKKLRDKQWSCVALSVGFALKKALEAVVASKDTSSIEVQTPWVLPQPHT